MKKANSKRYESRSLDFQKKARALSDLFAEYEGRRPRIIIGSISENSKSDLNYMANMLSDSGFDVDISPEITIAETFAMNALENDVDALLIITSSSKSQDKLMRIENLLHNNKAEIIMSIISEQGQNEVKTQGLFKNWSIVDNQTPSELGFRILDKLLCREN